MASLPQPKFEPKAPDKNSPPSVACDVDITKIQESDCSNNNKSKSLSIDLSNLNTASFKSLLEEVVAYDTAKQTKSELYNNLLEDVTQNGEDDVKRPLHNQRLVDSQTDIDKSSSKDNHIKENSSLEPFDLAPDFKKRPSGVTTKVSARQLEGGSLPSHVNHAQALSVLINKKNTQNTRKKIAESSKMAKNVDVMVDLGDIACEPGMEKVLKKYFSHASLEISPAKDETKIDDQITTPLLSKQLNQHYEEPGTCMEIDASPYTKDSKDGMTKVLPRTSGEGDQDVKNCVHQPATGVMEFSNDEQVDHRMLQLFGSQINCYQNPYNEFTPPMSFHFLTPNDNLGLQTTYNNNKKPTYEDTSNFGLKRNKQKKEAKKKDSTVRSEDIKGYRGDKNIDEILEFIGDKSGDSKKNKGSKTKSKIKSRNGKGSDDDCGRPKNRKMKMTKYNSVEEVSTTVFQHMDSSEDESKSIKINKKAKKKISKQNQSSKKFASTEQRLDVLSSESQDTDSADFLLVTNKQRRKKQKSQNKLNTTTSNFPPHDSYLLSQYTQPKNVKNKKRRKSTSSMPHSDKSEDDNSDLDSVHSLPASSTPSKQPSYKEAPKTDLTKPARVVTTSEESIPTVTVALPQRNADVTTINVNNTNDCVNGDVHVTYIMHEPQRADLETAKKTAVLNKVPAAIPPQSASLTVRVPSKKKQSPIMYNKYEVDTSLSFGFEIDQNLLCDSGNDYSPPAPIPMPIEYNYSEVILFIKQAWQDVEKEKINGRSNILEYKRDNSSVFGEI